MIHTVLGELTEKVSGTVLMHEHIRCASNDMLHAFGQKWLDEGYLIAYASKILMQMKERYGIGLFVDATPMDLGRDVRLLKQVSEKSGIPMVASTGLYWYPSCVTKEHSAEEIAQWLLEECQNGMEGTDCKPGILKCATGDLGVTAENAKRLTALGMVQRKTGLPLYVHCTHEVEIADRQLEILFNQGADPEKIIMGHTAIRPEVGYLEGILKKGCYIAMDQCHCVAHSMETIARTLVTLGKRGYSRKILLSNDLCIYTDFGTRKDTGLQLTVQQQTNRFGHLFHEVYNAFCAAGGSEQDWETMLCKNPWDVLNV